MDLKDLLEYFGDVIPYIKSHHFGFWHKYIEGVNMTSIVCKDDNFVPFPKYNNTFYLRYKNDQKEVWEEPDDPKIVYLSDLVAPILIELGKTLNYSLHFFRTYGCNGDDYDLNQLVWNHNITALDDVPMNYEYETRVRGFYCSKPLYVSNGLMMISKKVPKPLPPVIDIWKSLSLDIWLLVITSFTVFITIDLMTQFENRKKRPRSLFHLIWIYSKPILGIGEDLGFHNYLYALWLLSLFPLIEIIKNDLFEHLVNRNVSFADTLGDLLDNRLVVYTDGYKKADWTNPKFTANWTEITDFYKDFTQLTQKLSTIDQDFGTKFVGMLGKNPQNIQDWLNGVALVNDENWIELLRSFLPRFTEIHVGQGFMPLHITPLCSGPQFPFLNEAYALSERLYETSIFQYWYQLKNKYFFSVMMRIFKASILDGIPLSLSDLYYEEFEGKGLQITHMKTFFEFVGFSFSFCSIVLLIECFIQYNRQI